MSKLSKYCIEMLDDKKNERIRFCTCSDVKSEKAAMNEFATAWNLKKIRYRGSEKVNEYLVKTWQAEYTKKVNIEVYKSKED